MRKRPSRTAPGGKRPWLIESDELSQPPEDDDLRGDGGLVGDSGAIVAASPRLWGSASAEPSAVSSVGPDAKVRPHVAQNRASALVGAPH